MHWFKHFSNASEDEFIAALEDEFGLEGYARWWKLLEVIAKQMKKPGQCSASFPIRLWCSYLVVRRPLLFRYLSVIEQQGKIKTLTKSDILTITCPKLLEIKDNYQKDLQGACKKLAGDLLPEVEVDIELKEEKNKDSGSSIDLVWNLFLIYEKQWKLDYNADREWIRNRIVNNPKYIALDLEYHARNWADWVETQHRLKQAGSKNKFPTTYKNSLNNWLKGEAEKKQQNETQKAKAVWISCPNGCGPYDKVEHGECPKCLQRKVI